MLVCQTGFEPAYTVTLLMTGYKPVEILAIKVAAGEGLEPPTGKVETSYSRSN